MPAKPWARRKANSARATPTARSTARAARSRPCARARRGWRSRCSRTAWAWDKAPASPAATAGLAGALSHAHAVLLHRLRQPLRALAHGLERAALAVDRAVGVALAEFAFRLAHGFAGIAELTPVSYTHLRAHETPEH